MTVFRQANAAVRLLLVMTVLLGFGYSAVITLAAQAFPSQANGSLVTNAEREVVGSALLGQSFEGPQWFWSRPSASDYSGLTSGGSNLSPVSTGQLAAMDQRRRVLEESNPDAVGPVPLDALTASASGLDPHISIAYARWQVPRIATARGIEVVELEAMITATTEAAPLGYLGQDGVNVVKLNLLLSHR